MAEQQNALRGIAPKTHWESTKNLSLLRTVRKPSTVDNGDGKIIGVFLNVDLRQGHEGLAQIAKGRDLDINALKNGNFIVFLNSSKDRMKLFCAQNIVAYYRSPSGKINLNIIKEIPKVFNATGEINFDAALGSAIDQLLARKVRSKKEKEA